MTATQTLPTTIRDDVQPLAWDLAYAWGTLSEIATTWRRNRRDIPQLPLALPLRLQDAARQLAADARLLGGAAPHPRQAAFLARQLAALSAQAAAAQAITCGPGRPGIGDALLWESLTATLRSAAARLATAPRYAS